MKKGWILTTVILLVGLISFSALSMSSTYYLRSRLTNLTAELYKEMSDIVEPEEDEYYTLALLPLMDVNGDVPELTTYLHQKMAEVISQFPGIRVADYVETVNAWNTSREQQISDSERFRALGRKLHVDVLIMTSLVTHSTHYTINGMVIETATGRQHEIDQIILERNLMDELPQDEIAATARAVAESLRKAAPPSVTDNTPGTQPGGSGTNGSQPGIKPGGSGTNTGQPGTQPNGSGTNTGQPGTQPNGSGTNTGQPGTQPNGSGTNGSQPGTQPGGSGVNTGQPGTQPTGSGTNGSQPVTQPGASVNPPSTGQQGSIISGATQTPTVNPPVNSTLPGSTDPGLTPGNESVPAVPAVEPVKYQLVLKEQSPPLSSILLGMDMGDFNGDGVDEVVCIAGPSIQVRNLNNYYFNWTYDKYQPTTRDYKILAIDLDGDGKDEIASHGSLLKVVNNKLVTQQPRFVARPVALYKHSGVALFDKNSIYVVNYQGLVMKEYVMNAAVKRFVFADLEGDGTDEIIALMDGDAENMKAQIYTTQPLGAKQTLTSPKPVEGAFSSAIAVLDLNRNGLPEIYLSRNVFSGTDFLYSKIYAYEHEGRQFKLIAESPELSYFIVDFAGYPKKVPNRLVVGGMTMKSKTQSPSEIKSKILYFVLE